MTATSTSGCRSRMPASAGITARRSSRCARDPPQPMTMRSGAPRRRGRRRVPELVREHGPPRVQRRAVQVERRRRELQAVGLARQQRAQAALDQVGRPGRCRHSGRAGEQVLRDLEDRELSMPAARGDDRQQVGIGDVANHQHVRVQQHARIEQRRRHDRSADDRDVGQLAQRAARLARAVHRGAFVDRLRRAHVRDQQARAFAGGRGRRQCGSNRRAHVGRRF